MSQGNYEELLRDIKMTLDEIKGLLILIYHDELENRKKELLREGSIKKKIYELCDGTRSATEIAQEIGKSVSYVSAYLSILRREGLIRKVVKEGKVVHEQII